MVRTITNGEPEATSGQIGAYFDAPSGAFLRIRGYETDGGDHVEAVELVDPEPGAVMKLGRVKAGDATVTTICESGGMEPTQIYNGMVEPLMRSERKAAKEVMAEAKAQDDVITYMAQKEYVEELDEKLADYE